MAHEMRLIDLDLAIAKIKDDGILGAGYSDDERINDVCDMLESCPTIEAEPVVHGRWIRNGNKNECDQCGFFYHSPRADYRRCPMCEAKMGR